MAEAETEAETDDEEPKKSSKMPLIIGVVLALVGGGGGFFAAWSGMILGDPPAEEMTEKEEEKLPESPDVAYVAVDPLVISMRPPSTAKHLRFRANLEVNPAAQADVETLLPRVTDVLNSYLRALEPSDLEDPSALTRLRAQMLRRVQVVTGTGRVNDLLIMEFVLN